jgi:hypothetical protein
MMSGPQPQHFRAVDQSLLNGDGILCAWDGAEEPILTRSLVEDILNILSAPLPKSEQEILAAFQSDLAQQVETALNAKQSRTDMAQCVEVSQESFITDAPFIPAEEPLLEETIHDPETPPEPQGSIDNDAATEPDPPADAVFVWTGYDEHLCADGDRVQMLDLTGVNLRL